MYCRNCSNEVAPQAIACPKCGVPPLKGKNFCNSCGKETHPDAIICIHCGISLQKTPMNMNIDKKNLLGVWSKYSYSNYVLILLISLMPFVNFKCTNEKVLSLTGYNLAVGKERTYTKTVDYGMYGSHDWKKKETIFSLDICIFYVSILSCLVLLITSYRRKFKYARNITIVSLLILIEWYIFTSIRISDIDLGMIDVSFGAGYWLTLVVCILSLIMLTYYLKEHKETEILQEPLITPQPFQAEELKTTLSTEPIVTKSIGEYVAPVYSEMEEEYPITKSNKSKYIIGGLITIIVILLVLFLFQREQTNNTTSIQEDSVDAVQKTDTSSISNNTVLTNNNSENSNTTLKNERKLKYLFASNGGLLGFYDDGTVATCPRCDLIKENIDALNSKEVNAKYESKNGYLLMNNERMDIYTNGEISKDWAMVDYKWLVDISGQNSSSLFQGTKKFCDDTNSWYYLVTISQNSITLKSFPGSENSAYSDKSKPKEIVKGIIKDGKIVTKDASEYLTNRFKFEDGVLSEVNNEGSFNDYKECGD